MTKPRILCLHGGGSNNDITVFQTGGLKLAAYGMECVFLHAPHVVNYCYPGLNRLSNGPFYVWANPMAGSSEQGCQWDDSMDYIAKFCKEHGPFDGVYGFSQGTAVITTFSHPNIWKDKFQMKECPWKFAILACGGASFQISIPRDDPAISFSSFHIFGARDPHLNDSKSIAEYWDSSKKETYTHGRGHEIDLQMGHREGALIPRILCLHGSHSNNEITPFQTMGLKLSERMECIYLHAPHISNTCYPGLDQLSEGPFYTWADSSKSLSDQDDQWDESLEYLAKFCKERGPFDGVYAFSQGAAIITNFSHPKIWKDRFRMKYCPWKFAILACAGSNNHLTITKSMTITKMSSFHIFGRKDTKHLNDSKRWRTIGIHHKGGGHEIAMQMSEKETEIMSKLDNFLDEQFSPKGEAAGVRKLSDALSRIFCGHEIYLCGFTFGRRSSD
ncbi:hypothetical protein ACHAXR_007558 [Thalassiosira sp. AJA248-18]